MHKIKFLFQSDNLLRFFVGAVFLSAGIFRIFNWEAATAESLNLNLNPAYFPFLITSAEIIGGLFLILGVHTKKVLLFFSLFLLVALFLALKFSGNLLLRNASEVFTFQISPTDLFLHFTYLIIIGYLLLKKSPN